MSFRGFDAPRGPEDLIGEASFDPARWHLAARAIGEAAHGWHCELADGDVDAGPLLLPQTDVRSGAARSPRPADGFAGWRLVIPRSRWSLVLRPDGQASGPRLGEEAAASMLRRLVPAVLRAGRIGDRLRQGKRPETADIEAAWDRLDYGVVATDARLVPIVMNIAAENLLESRRMFRPLPAGARLQCALPAADEELEKAATAVLSGAPRARFTIEATTSGRLRIEIVWPGTKWPEPGRPRHETLVLILQPEDPLALIRG